MNLRDKLRMVGGHNESAARTGTEENRDCRHLAVVRPMTEFPGALEVRAETIRRMSRAEIPEDLDPRKILYLDTETTGLGGAGTVAFLVGMGYLTDNGFEVHQFLMRDYDEEGYLLRHVAAGLEKFDVICTFNGATFDLPLLESRMLMNREPRGCLDKPHIDLLQIARRLWKKRLGACNLGRLEALILGQPREDDMPGSEVPARYFEYLKTKREDLLDDILRHNAQDIASLCVLLTHMAGMYEHPENVHYSEDVYSMGRSLEKLRYTEDARKCYRLARKGRMGAEASGALARSYRRAGDREEAARIWQEMINTHRGGAHPYIEMAKYYEHVKRDDRAALEMTDRAIALLSETRLGDGLAVQETENELQYRRRRLKRRIAARAERAEQEEDYGTADRIQGQ